MSEQTQPEEQNRQDPQEDPRAPEPDPQTALPQTSEWSNAPTDEVALSDDQPALDEDD